MGKGRRRGSTGETRHDRLAVDEFDAIIRAIGRRSLIAARLRSWAWRLVHQPAWTHGLAITSTMFGAPGSRQGGHAPLRPTCATDIATNKPGHRPG